MTYCYFVKKLLIINKFVLIFIFILYFKFPIK